MPPNSGPRRLWVILLTAVLAALAPGCRLSLHPTPDASAKGVRVHTPLFTDTAAAAGVRFTHTNGADGKFYYIEITGAGCAFVDYDHDGFPDILLVQSGPSGPLAPGRTRPHCALYHNNGNGTFTDVTAGSGLDKDLGYAQGVAVGDYDNDGCDDLFLTSYPHNFLFHNERGSGKFTDVTHRMGLDKPHSTGYATSAAFGDYDNDGRLDLCVCYYAPWTPAGDKPCQSPQGSRDYCSPQIYDPDTPQLWHNDGAHFTDVTHKAGLDAAKGRGLAVAFLDYNGDGRQDILIANDITPNMLWRNNGDGTFTNDAARAGVAYAEGGQLMAGMGIGLADYDHSGRESLFLSNFSGQPKTLFRNTGHGLFEDRSTVSGLSLPQMNFLSFGCEFLDYDADGWPDLIVANGHVQVHIAETSAATTYAERKQLFRNGGGAFQEVDDPAALGDLALPTVARGLAVGDYDNDGRLDVLVNNQNGPAQLFHNRDRSPNHWVSFKTVGVKSNRDGYGARFTLLAGGMRQAASVRAGSSYLSHSDSRVYFGLGAASRIERVSVLWPSGARDELRGLDAGAVYVVTEGKGITGRQPPGPHRALPALK
jgi:hypothetical protein